MTHAIHSDHGHVHNEHCGHVRIKHDGHVDYVHDGHLHAAHGDHYDEHVLALNDTHHVTCTSVECACVHDDCDHPTVPHGDHVDYLYEGRLHHRHGDHCDDHGPVEVL